MQQDHRKDGTRMSKSSFPPKESKSKILRGYCGDQLSRKYCRNYMDRAYGPMAQSEDVNQSEDGQLR